MKKNWLCLMLIFFAPAVIIVLYTLATQWAYDYAARYFEATYKFIILFAGNLLIGIMITLVCMKAFRQKAKHIPFEYAAGMLLIPFVILYHYLPILPPGIVIMVYNYSIPQCFIIGAVYTCLCVYTLRRRGKDLSVKGDIAGSDELQTNKVTIDL